MEGVFAQQRAEVGGAAALGLRLQHALQHAVVQLDALQGACMKPQSVLGCRLSRNRWLGGMKHLQATLAGHGGLQEGDAAGCLGQREDGVG